VNEVNLRTSDAVGAPCVLPPLLAILSLTFKDVTPREGSEARRRGDLVVALLALTGLIVGGYFLSQTVPNGDPLCETDLRISSCFR